MKLLFLLVFIGCALSHEQVSINKVFNNVVLAIEELRNTGMLEVTLNQRECMKNKVKLNDIGEKVAEMELASSVILLAGLLCLDDKSQVLQLVQENQNLLMPESVECFMRRLQELEPKSKFLDNYDFKPTESCPEPTLPEEKLDAKLKEITQRNFGCLKADKKQIEIAFIKFTLANVLSRKNDGLPNDAKSELVEDVIKQNEMTFECSMNKLLKSLE
jgi:hypothetical protein